MEQVNLLAIDGGGIRGLIPLHFLYVIEQLTGRRIPDLFSLIGGTSTGAIVACGLSLKSNSSSSTSPFKYTSEDIIKTYENEAKQIFSGSGIKYFQSRYSPDGLNNVLNDWFGDNDLGGCAIPIVVPTYDTIAFQPVFFKSRYYKDVNSTYHQFARDIKLKEILRATTAAPTYFPALEIIEKSKDQKMKLIDGGLFNNNPSLSVLMELVSFPEFYGIDLDKVSTINLLSLGTGRSKKANKTPKGGGQWQYREAGIDISMYGNAQAVDYVLSELKTDKGSLLRPKLNYLRLSPEIEDKDFAELDCTDPEAFRYYRKLANRYLIGRDDVANFLRKLQPPTKPTVVNS